MRPLGWLGAVARLSGAWIVTALFITRASVFWRAEPPMHFAWIAVVLWGVGLFLRRRDFGSSTMEYDGWSIAMAAAGLAALFATQIYQAVVGFARSSMTGVAVGAALVIIANLRIVVGPGRAWRLFPVVAFVLLGWPLPSSVYEGIGGVLITTFGTILSGFLQGLGYASVFDGGALVVNGRVLRLAGYCGAYWNAYAGLLPAVFCGIHFVRGRAACIILLLVAGAVTLGALFVQASFIVVYLIESGRQPPRDPAGWFVLLGSALAVAVTTQLIRKFERNSVSLASGVASPAG